MTDLERIEKKLDLIIDALGLSRVPSRSPGQLDELAKSIVLKFREKQDKKNAHEKG
jgi:hypothetical protein